MTPAAKNRLVAGAALLAAGVALAFIAFGNIGENLVYYWSPSEMLAQGAKAYGPTIRLGGVVEPGSVQWNPAHTTLQFAVADNREPTAKKVLVATSQTPPQMFRAGIGVVVEGTFDASQVFKSDRLMVNHSNEYRPPSEGEKRPDWKGTLSDSAGGGPAGAPAP